jgi:hypothetical protein
VSTVRSSCLHFEGPSGPISADDCEGNMENAVSFETSVTIEQSTRTHIQEKIKLKNV